MYIYTCTDARDDALAPRAGALLPHHQRATLAVTVVHGCLIYGRDCLIPGLDCVISGLDCLIWAILELGTLSCVSFGATWTPEKTHTPAWTPATTRLPPALAPSSRTTDAPDMLHRSSSLSSFLRARGSDLGGVQIYGRGFQID